jgi:hypothetical protein
MTIFKLPPAKVTQSCIEKPQKCDDVDKFYQVLVYFQAKNPSD